MDRVQLHAIFGRFRADDLLRQQQELAELRGGEPAKPVLRRMRGKGNELEWYVIFGIQRCRVNEWMQVPIPTTVEEFDRGNGFAD